MNRKDFIKKSCTLCIALSGAGVAINTLQGCATNTSLLKVTAKQKKIEIDKSALDATKKYYIVREADLEFDILLLKKETRYTATYLQCTHANNPVVFTQNEFYCNAHNSRFDIDGNVTAGPAPAPLHHFAVIENEKSIIINL